MRFIAGRPVGIALAIVSLSVAACGGSDEGTDSAVLRDLASNDHAVSACLPSTPPTSLFEVFCQVGASGYCFNESLNPFFWPGTLGVGDSLEILYQVPGPLPVGGYHVGVRGSQQTQDALLHFSLRLRGADASAGAADREFAAGDATTSRSDDGGVPPGQVGIDLTAPAVAAKCGDYLVLKITMVSGGSPYLEFFATLDLP